MKVTFYHDFAYKGEFPKLDPFWRSTDKTPGHFE